MYLDGVNFSKVNTTNTITNTTLNINNLVILHSDIESSNRLYNYIKSNITTDKTKYVYSDVNITENDEDWIFNNINYNVFKVTVSDGDEIVLQNDRRGDITTWDEVTDWGDGTQDNNITHTYTTGGEYIITTKWNVSRIPSSIGESIADTNTLRKVTEVYTININMSNLYKLYAGCTSLTKVVYLSICNNVRDMYGMFKDCSSLEEVSLSMIDSSDVRDMGYLFSGCTSLTSIDLTGWDCRKVKNINYMFNNCNSLTDIYDFENIVILARVEGRSLFSNCNSLTNIDISNIKFKDNISNMFANCNTLTSINGLEKLVTKYITNTSGLLNGCYGLDNDEFNKTTHWDTRNVTDMSYMFNHITDNVNESTKSIDISNWETINCLDMSYMFANNPKLTFINISNVSLSNDVSHMFDNCGVTTLVTNDTNGERTTIMNSIFNNCINLQQINTGMFTTVNVTDLSNVFSGCTSLTSLDLSMWNTKKVTNMTQMLKDCGNMLSLNINNVNFVITSSTVTDEMMIGCVHLKNTSNIKMSNCTDETKYRISQIANTIQII